MFTPAGYLGIYLVDADDAPVLTGMDWLDNQELSSIVQIYTRFRKSAMSRLE